MGQCSFIFAGLSDGARIHVGDPALVGAGAVLGNDQPEQPERGLATVLAGAFPGITAWASEAERDPLQWK
jgi:hypothetical protein